MVDGFLPFQRCLQHIALIQGLELRTCAYTDEAMPTGDRFWMLGVSF